MRQLAFPMIAAATLAACSAAPVAHAEGGEEEVELAHALEAGNAEDLALAEREARVAELGSGRETVDGDFMKTVIQGHPLYHTTDGATP